MLGITYTELEKQPMWWVEKSLQYLSEKNKHEEREQKRQARKSANKRTK